ncbi:SRPBCC domain-containing protein [Pontibacter chitinilyticus]|uniref:SRPBCC domain-containing protein n=1 Tax=Pontibacter chitinilyticus TaxID=2674989 RepID=UPI00321A8FA0
MNALQINTALQIQKPPHTVFEALVEPQHMAHYFISESTGSMEAGKTLHWKFPEFDLTFPIRVLEVLPDTFIAFEWEGEPGKQLQVEIRLEELPGNSTLVKISEGPMENDAAGIQWLGRNTAGWANFLACLKAYVEYGINLRKGAFDFMKH